MLRTRASAGPLPLLWLAVLLLSIVFTHGMTAESAEGHVTAGVAAPVSASAGIHEGHTGGAGDAVAYASLEVETSEDRHDGEGSAHAGQECVSGQPQQGLDLAAPCLVMLDWAPPTHAYAVGKSGLFRPEESALPPMTGTRDSVVQQV
ncbi:MAG TPA: hypothetical protein DEQ61_02570 [Streptomyces sp.]|nr:hypothetical protein [Streptomyces sp.]